MARQRIDLDIPQLEKLAAMQCSVAEVAAWFGVSETTIRNKLKQAQYGEAFNAGKAKGRVSLRRAQWDAAKKGSNTMLVWLGKQWLGQKDGDPDEGLAGKAAIVELCERLRADAGGKA